MRIRTQAASDITMQGFTKSRRKAIDCGNIHAAAALAAHQRSASKIEDDVRLVLDGSTIALARSLALLAKLEWQEMNDWWALFLRGPS